MTGARNNNCLCKTGGTCHCCTPRKSAPRNRKREAVHPEQIAYDSGEISNSFRPSGSHASRTPSHILARLAELRPVAPRPTSGPLHDPSCGHTIRHHSHENLSFSPYGRAYDLTHEQMYDQDPINGQTFISPGTLSVDPTSSIPMDEQIFRTQLRALETAATSPWAPISFPSACGCGDSCSCPGCGQHSGNGPTASSSAFSSCTNPGICNTCLDCTILSLPASLPPDTSLSIFDAYQTDSIDEWIRQVSSLPHPSPTIATPSPDTVNATALQVSWDNPIPSISQPRPKSEYIVQECCGVLCRCRPETCKCEIDNVDGYDCRLEMEIPSLPVPDNNPYGSARSDSAGAGYSDPEFTPYLSVPDVTRSRSSSTSSQSSLGHDQYRQSGCPKPNISPDHSTHAGLVRGPFVYNGSFSSPDLGKSLQAIFPALSTSSSSPLPPRSTMSGSPMEGDHSYSYPNSNPDMDNYGSSSEKPSSST